MANAHWYGPFHRQYGVALAAADINSKIRVLLEDGAGAAYTGAVVAGDVKVSKDGGAEANIAALPTHLFGGIWEFVLDATEAAAYTITIRVVKAGIALTVITVETTLAVGRWHIDATPIGGNTPAFSALAAGNHSAMYLVGGPTGHGINTVGGATSGFGLRATATNANQNNNLFTVTESAEPTGPPANAATVMEMEQYIKRRFYNKVTQTITTQLVYKDDSTTILCTMAVADDGTTQSKGKAT